MMSHTVKLRCCSLFLFLQRWKGSSTSLLLIVKVLVPILTFLKWKMPSTLHIYRYIYIYIANVAPIPISVKVEVTFPFSVLLEVAIHISSIWMVEPIPKVVIHSLSIYVTKIVIPMAISLMMDATTLIFKATVAMHNSSIISYLICHDDSYCTAKVLMPISIPSKVEGVIHISSIDN